MATDPRPPESRRRVIVAPRPGAGGRRAAFKLVAVWMVSAALHGGMLLAFYYLLTFIGLNKLHADDNSVHTVLITPIADEPPDADLSQIEPGTDQVEINYPVTRLEDVSVPGQVDPTAQLGLPGAPELLRQNVPPPPGSGGGPGGGVPTLDAGSGPMGLPPGGYIPGVFRAGSFDGRSSSTRQWMLNTNGGNDESEAAVARGLKWFALHQAPDGHWSLNDFQRFAHADPSPASKTFVCTCTGQVSRQDDIAGTSFGLLPFLAAGFTHRPGKDPKQIDYSKTVKAGLDYLIAKQGKDGFFGGSMYSHGLSTIALCEAYGMTSDPMRKTPAQRAVNYIVAAQDPAGGGWRYSPRTPGDTSVTGWQLMALKSGQMAGLDVPADALKKVTSFLDAVESNNKGRYSYLPGSGETPVMTAVGMLCRQYLGVNPRNPGLLKGVDYLKDSGPGKTGNIYYEYYATQVMHHMGGDAWEAWNKGPAGDGKGGIRDTLIAKQDKIGDALRPLPLKLAHQDGSWAPEYPDGGRVMTTSLSLLTLEVYYRHLPLYRKDVGVMKEAETGNVLSPGR